MSGKKTASSQKLAFVLGGGGARGALQVGALRALLAAGIMPDMMIGASIGAVNATFLTIHGLTLAGLDTLERAWGRAAQADLLPGSYLWLTTRVFFNRAGIHPYHHRLRNFFIEQGISPEMTFADLSGPRLFQVATDLNHFTVRLYGTHSQQKVLDGLLASTAIPPWVRPLEMDGTLLMDGGALSNLPIESAIRLGATKIIALDLFDPRPAASPDMGFGPFVSKLLASVENRQIEMELAYAEARGVPVTHVALRAEQTIVLWDFSRYQELIVRGYALMEEMLADYRPTPPARPWYQRLLSGLHK